VGDTYWMKGIVRVDWKDTVGDWEHLVAGLKKQNQGDKLPFLNSLIQDFIFQNTQYQVTDTGSQYLFPEGRQNMIKVNFVPTKMRAAICLN
jgi:hypothetical protein